MFPALLRAPRQALSATAWPPPAALACVPLLALLAYPTLSHLAETWRRSPDYEFAWLLLPAVAWLFARARPWAAAERPQPALGLATLLAGGVLHLAARVITWPLLDFAGWFLIARGLTLGLWGRTAARRVLPVLLFSLFLFPLPSAWLNAAALWLQDLIGQIAAFVLGVFWVCHRQGSLIHVAGLETPLAVAVECSGVRQLLVFAALAAFLALFVQGNLRRTLLIASALPVAVAANLVRVLTLCTIARLGGAGAIEGSLHELPLLLTLPLGALCLWALYTRLRTTPSSTETVTTPRPASLPPYRRHAAALAVVVALQWMLHVHLQSAPGLTTGAAAIDLDALPAKLGNWRGEPHPEADQVAARSDYADATLTRAYQDGKGNAVALHLVWSRSGRDREHHPEICLRDAAGAAELPAARRLIPLQEDPRRNAQRFAYQRARVRQTTVYYWHYTVLPPRQGLSLLQSLYLRQHERLPSLTVQVQVNRTDPRTWEAIEQTLLPEVDRWLQAHLPATAKVGCERLPVRLVIND